MKKDIHPKCYQNVSVKCACGALFITSSTKQDLETEVCSNCHPFYTGKKIVIDVMGKVEKFNKRAAKKETLKKKIPTKKQEE